MRESHDSEARASYYQVRRSRVAYTEDSGIARVIIDYDRRGRVRGIELLHSDPSLSGSNTPADTIKGAKE